MKTLTLAPWKGNNHEIIVPKNHKNKKKIQEYEIARITMDFGGRLDLNLARTTPLLPWGLQTLPQMQR